MPQDLTLYVVCGLAVLCSVLLVVGFFTFRFAFRYIGLFTKSLIRSDQEDEDAQKPLRLPRRRVDLRAKAQASNFDAAVAQAQTAQNPAYPAQAAPPAAPAPLPHAAPSPFGNAPVSSTPPSPFGNTPAPSAPPSPFGNESPPPSPFGDDPSAQTDDFRRRLRKRGQSREEYDALYGSDDDEGFLGLP